MNRLQSVDQKDPTIQDLQMEISTLRSEVKTLSTRISLLEARNNEEIFSDGEEFLQSPIIPPYCVSSPPIDVSSSKDPNQEILNLEMTSTKICIKIQKSCINGFVRILCLGLLSTPKLFGGSNSELNPSPAYAFLFPEAYKIVETDASHIGYGGILKQRSEDKEQLVRFTFGHWNRTMTTPKYPHQMTGKALRSRGNTRYNFRQIRRSIGSSSSSSYKDNILENSAYNTHDNLWDIFIIEDEEEDLLPLEVENNYLNKDWAILQRAYGKSRDYYEEILRVTKSAIFTHNYEKDVDPREANPPYQFLKMEILKIISKKQWGIDPTRTRDHPAHVSPRLSRTSKRTGAGQQVRSCFDGAAEQQGEEKLLQCQLEQRPERRDFDGNGIPVTGKAMRQRRTSGEAEFRGGQFPSTMRILSKVYGVGLSLQMRNESDESDVWSSVGGGVVSPDYRKPVVSSRKKPLAAAKRAEAVVGGTVSSLPVNIPDGVVAATSF
ncbi:hypothetical protein RJ640_022187 [Escallonia rubra]|uniref:Uncharacterized protein n=1 Tax=Escallonia rubra TaxID=112253 RepID=A0AA88QMI4_9ASTE|nr:hypothetical protein RJ640_022187 [Escallonia rubra]